MPSRFEPCGLKQLYASATARCRSCARRAASSTPSSPWDPATGSGTGFRFDQADGTALLWGLDQALAAYGDPRAWPQLMRNGMARDFSWDRSAREYERVYRRARQIA